MTSEAIWRPPWPQATKISVKGNKHMDTRIIKVSGFKSEVKLDHRGCFEAAKPLKPPEFELKCFMVLVDQSL